MQDKVYRLPAGVLDMSRARELWEFALDQAMTKGPVSLDCSAVERLDSSAVQILVALRRAVERQGRTFELCHLNANILEELRRAGSAIASSGTLPARARGKTQTDQGNSNFERTMQPEA